MFMYMFCSVESIFSIMNSIRFNNNDNNNNSRNNNSDTYDNYSFAFFFFFFNFNFAISLVCFCLFIAEKIANKYIYNFFLCRKVK